MNTFRALSLPEPLAAELPHHGESQACSRASSRRLTLLRTPAESASNPPEMAGRGNAAVAELSAASGFASAPQPFPAGKPEAGPAPGLLSKLAEAQMQVEPIEVLSVGQPEPGSLVREALRGATRFRLSTARDYRELWLASKYQAIHLAILHKSLGPFELEEAGQLIRRRCPHVAILVIRKGEGFLEDALYDDRVVPPVTPEGLLATIQKLANRVDAWRLPDGNR